MTVLHFLNTPQQLTQLNLEQSMASLKKLHEDYEMVVRANQRLERENRELSRKLEKHQGQMGGNVLRKMSGLVANDIKDEAA